MRYLELKPENLTVEQVVKFWGKVDIQGEKECWLWRGSVGRAKYGAVYGRYSVGRRTYLAHRVAYVLWVGVIPEGMTLDHVKERCGLRGLCCNPGHLEVVTREENIRRYWAGQPEERECVQGHGVLRRGEICRKCAVESVARTQRKYPEKYREMKRLQKAKERARKKGLLC